MEKYVLVYDADCGPCTRFKRVVDFLDSYRRLDFISLIEADEDGLLDVVPLSLRHRSFHLVSPDGRVRSGAGAVPSLIGLLPSGRPIARSVVSSPWGLRSVNFVYSIFSRLHDSGSCQYRPGRPSGDVKETARPLDARFGYYR